jgi:hypothetical protein
MNMNKKILLVAINSRFNHVSLAIRSIEAYVRRYAPHCFRAGAVPQGNVVPQGNGVPQGNVVQTEHGVQQNDAQFILQTKYFTINQPLLEILQGIAMERPDAVLFSVYIWNVALTMNVIAELKKILPDCLIAVGGPEVSYDAEKVLARNTSLDIVMAGEGERTVTEFCEAIASKSVVPIGNIKGLYVRTKQGFINTGKRPLIENMDLLPFPYDDGTGHLVEGVDADNSIIYYESSRGCPFRCSYCLSSVDKSVRFASLDRVKHDLSFFLQNNVRLVKFVDRTYNLNEDRYIAIWEFIKDHWNGKTTFHFEIAAQQFTDRALEAIKDVPYGCMQFEIGIQSTNPPTLETVGRPADMAQIHHVLAAIPKTIHVHLDLIAGLPLETIKEFSSSFNYTIAQNPQMLQLGFLKILHGTAMESYAHETPGYEWLSTAPYEVLRSPWVSYEEMVFLKRIDNLVDNYYNSQDFVQTMKFIISLQKDTFKFFTELAAYFTTNGLFDLPHKSDAYYAYLHDFISAQQDFFSRYECAIIIELLRFDYTRRSKPGVYPSWYVRNYDKEAHRIALENYYDMHSTRDAYSDSSYEVFSINPLTFDTLPNEAECAILFLYNSHHITGAASKTAIRSGDCLCIDCTGLKI